MADIIATENDARIIGGSSASYTSNLCATKTRAEALSCRVNGNYVSNLLVPLNTLSASKNYFKTTATSAGTISFSDTEYSNSIDYSLDGGTTWTTIQESGSTPNLSSGTEVLWRLVTGTPHEGIGLFSSTCNFTVSGNIMSLFYGANFENQTTLYEGCFQSLFLDCIRLTDASGLILPAMTLTPSCYASMFEGCTGLVNPPSLPATTLAASCYAGMFTGCTSLITSPSLPATSFAESCYAGMFSGTNRLPDVSNINFSNTTHTTSGVMKGLFQGTKVTYSDLSRLLPKDSRNRPCLPVLGYYSSMFTSCKLLVTPPLLPSTTLLENCYYAMFSDCTALTSIPTLPATNLVTLCYWHMFSRCTSLTSVQSDALPATSLALNCYSYMFWKCTSLTGAPGLPATTLAHGCYSYMFVDCTSLVNAPSLPATTLANSCYYYMFGGCTSMRESPVLCATTLVSNCYSYMFTGCSSLSKITFHGNILSYQYTNYWVHGVAASGTFYRTSDLTAIATGDDKIPSGWSVANVLEVTQVVRTFGMYLPNFNDVPTNVNQVTFNHTITVLAHVDDDSVATSGIYEPTVIATFQAGVNYPISWDSSEGAFIIGVTRRIEFSAPWINDYDTDFHVIVDTYAGNTGTCVTFNNGSTATYNDCTIPYTAAYFKRNGNFPVCTLEEAYSSVPNDPGYEIYIYLL